MPATDLVSKAHALKNKPVSQLRRNIVEASLGIEQIVREYLDKEPPKLRRDMTESEIELAERETEELLKKQRDLIISLRKLRLQYGADPADLDMLDKLLSLI